jgi:hypothetical protein
MLSEDDLIDNQPVAPGTHRSVRSRMRATPLLLDLMTDTTIAPVRPSELLILRDINGNLVDYPETQLTRRLRKRLLKRNEYLGDIRLGFNNPAIKVGNHCVFIGENAYAWHLRPYDTRNFCRGSFFKGGRFYGPHQQLPSAVRAQLIINGQPVVCLDYRAMHTTIFSNDAGIRLDGDPYDITGFARDEVKFGINIAFNAKTLHGAKMALGAKWAEENGRQLASKEEYARATRVIEAILEKHSPIASAFGSDSGVNIQYRDSEIIRTVLEHCMQEGIPAVTVHDEVIAPKKHQGRIAELMTQAFEQHAPGPNKPALRVRDNGEAGRNG